MQPMTRRAARLPDIWQRKLVAGEISRGVCKALATYAGDRQVLAAVEADLTANPLYYSTWHAAEISVHRVAKGIVRAACSPGEPSAASIKSPRCAPVRGPAPGSESSRRLDHALRLVAQIREPWQLDELQAAIEKRRAKLTTGRGNK